MCNSHICVCFWYAYDIEIIKNRIQTEKHKEFDCHYGTAFMMCVRVSTVVEFEMQHLTEGKHLIYK